MFSCIGWGGHCGCFSETAQLHRNACQPFFFSSNLLRLLWKQSPEAEIFQNSRVTNGEVWQRIQHPLHSCIHTTIPNHNSKHCLTKCVFAKHLIILQSARLEMLSHLKRELQQVMKSGHSDSLMPEALKRILQSPKWQCCIKWNGAYIQYFWDGNVLKNLLCFSFNGFYTLNKSAFWSKLISDAVLKFDKVYEREIFDQQKRIFS